VHLPGGLYHVMLRGNGGQEIFFSDDDRYHLYLLIQEGVERFGHRIHGFCLMRNHLHLAVQVAEVALSKIVQNLAFRYTGWVNKRQGRVGHLFQGRYKAILVDGDAYLLELIRYIHLNPVRARMVREPRAYPWSGHRAYLGEEDLSWLSTDWVLGQLAKRRSTARQRYARFVSEGRKEGHREEFHRGVEDPRILGDDRFIETVLAPAAHVTAQPCPMDEIIDTVCGSYGVEEGELSAQGRRRDLAEARAVVAHLATAVGEASLTEVARRFGRDVATLSTGVRRLVIRSREGQLSQEAEAVLEMFGAGT
jgi:putative transposase